VFGAWLDSVATLVDMGLDFEPSLTATEVVAAGSAVMGEPLRDELTPLSSLVNGALYGTNEPGPLDVEGAWSHALSIERLSSESLTARARLFRAIDLRVIARRY
jgi:hypothetical protein